MTVDWINRIQKKIKPVWEKAEKYNFLTAICINAVFLVLILVFCEIKYETSDDYVMSAIMSGAYNGNPNPHLIFINILWGYLLLPFYNLIPQISWYLIFQLALCFCSFTAVTYILLKKLDVIMGIMLSVLFITFFSDDVYIMVQFTKTAILVVMAGSILFLQALFHKEIYRKREIFFSGLLTFSGSLIRFNVIYIAGGFLLIILTIEFIRRHFLSNDRKWKEGVQVVIIGAVLIGAVFSARELDRFVYNWDNGYAYFKDYGNERGNIVDKRDDGYEICAEEYQKIGLSENDYGLLRHWNFGDPDFYTLEQMKKVEKIISDYQSTLVFDWDRVKDDLKARNYWSYPSLWACIILLLLSIAFNKKYWWVSPLSLGVGYLYLCYFASSGRTVYRIEFSVFLCIFLTIIYFWDRVNCRKLKNKLEISNICGILIMLLCIYQVPTYRLNHWGEYIYGEEYKNYVEDNFFNSWNYDSRRYRCSVYNEAAFAELRQEVETNLDNFYFFDFNTAIQTLYLASNPWENEAQNVWRNSSYLGSVTVKFPDELKLLKTENVENPLKSLVNDDIYLIDNFYYEETLKYLQEHYYPEARIELYKTIDGFQIWKFYRN